MKTGPAAGGRCGSSAGSSASAARAELARAGGHLREAPRPARLDRRRLAEPGEHEAVAIRLLEAGEAVVGPPGAQNCSTEVELGRDWHRDRRQRPAPPAAPRARGRRRPARAAARRPHRRARSDRPGVQREPSRPTACRFVRLSCLGMGDRRRLSAWTCLDSVAGVWNAADSASLRAGSTPETWERSRKMAPNRLSALDESFLAVETASAHMHVGWAAAFDPPDEGPRTELRAAPRPHRAPPASRAPLPPASRRRAPRGGATRLGRRRPLRHHSPRAAG